MPVGLRLRARIQVILVELHVWRFIRKPSCKLGDAGFDHHMVKPVDLQALGQLLAELGAPAAAGGPI